MTEEQIIINKFVNDASDSIEIGTPSKGGAIKIYTDFSNKELTEQKIIKAFEARKYAQSLLEKEN